MSMQSYPEYGFGLVITGDEIGRLVERNHCEDEFELMEMIGDPCRIYNDEHEGKAFSADPGKKWAEDEPMLVIWAKKQPKAFEAAYKSPEEAAHEFELAYQQYFPLDYDFVGHLGYFQCTVYC